MRLLYGMDRLPTTMALDDARLPGVDLGNHALRLNTVPLAASAWPAVAGHGAQMAAYRDWLFESCSDYNRPARNFLGRYLDSVIAHVTRHRGELGARLARFDGLYAPEDFEWSALRPLPRAWLPQGRVDVAFWDGATTVAITLATLPDGDLVEAVLPDAFRQFWRSETLPMSPFRRALNPIAKARGIFLSSRARPVTRAPYQRS